MGKREWLAYFLEKPDTVFKQSLEVNPIFPFEIIGENVYALTVQHTKWYLFFLLTFLTGGLTALIYSLSEDVTETLIYPICLAIIFFRQTVFYWRERTYVLDSTSQMYEFYCGHSLIYRGHYHNIYIRVIGQNSGNGEVYYNVVLEGYSVDPEYITSAMTSCKKLVKLAKKLAYRLDVNYFEPSDRSRGHVIRHRCPYSEVAFRKIKLVKKSKKESESDISQELV